MSFPTYPPDPPSFSYLNLPADTFPTTPPTHQQQFFKVGPDKFKRKLYFNVDYTEEELELIRRFKAGEGKQVIGNASDQTILRYLYSTDMDMSLCATKMLIYHEWFNDPRIQTMNIRSTHLLHTGFVYLSGRDTHNHPLVVMDVSTIDLQTYIIEDYYAAINHVLKVCIGEMFNPGRIQTYTFILDVKGKLLSLPLGSLSGIIKKLGDVYSMRLQKLLIINCVTAVKFAFYASKAFLAQQTINKIMLLSQNDVKERKLLEWFPATELQFKYGGSKFNLQDYWPPQRSVLDRHGFRVTVHGGQEEEEFTEYYSVLIDNQLFVNDQSEHCCGSQQCTIY